MVPAAAGFFARCGGEANAAARQPKASDAQRRVKERGREIESMFYQHFQDKRAEHQDCAQSGIVLAMPQIKREEKSTWLFIHSFFGPIRCKRGRRAWHFTGVTRIAGKRGTQVLLFCLDHRKIDKGEHGQRANANPDVARRNNKANAAMMMEPR